MSEWQAVSSRQRVDNERIKSMIKSRMDDFKAGLSSKRKEFEDKMLQMFRDYKEECDSELQRALDGMIRDFKPPATEVTVTQLAMSPGPVGRQLPSTPTAMFFDKILNSSPPASTPVPTRDTPRYEDDPRRDDPRSIGPGRVEQRTPLPSGVQDSSTRKDETSPPDSGVTRHPSGLQESPLLKNEMSHPGSRIERYSSDPQISPVSKNEMIRPVGGVKRHSTGPVSSTKRHSTGPMSPTKKQRADQPSPPQTDTADEILIVHVHKERTRKPIPKTHSRLGSISHLQKQGISYSNVHRPQSSDSQSQSSNEHRPQSSDMNRPQRADSNPPQISDTHHEVQQNSSVVLKQEVDSPGVEFSSLHISSPRPLRKKSSSDESFTGGGSGEEDDASESDESDIVTAPHVKQSSKGSKGSKLIGRPRRSTSLVKEQPPTSKSTRSLRSPPTSSREEKTTVRKHKYSSSVSKSPKDDFILPYNNKFYKLNCPNCPVSYCPLAHHETRDKGLSDFRAHLKDVDCSKADGKSDWEILVAWGEEVTDGTIKWYKKWRNDMMNEQLKYADEEENEVEGMDIDMQSKK